MRVYIQSKSGNVNGLISWVESLLSCWEVIKNTGGYLGTCQGKEVFVPLHEVEFIREANENE